MKWEAETTIDDADKIYYEDSATGVKYSVPYSYIKSAASTESRCEIFTSNGNFTAPTGVTQIFLSGCGGGGGGGASDGHAAATNGGGGGASGHAVMNYPYTVVPGNTYSVVIGTGGAGGTGVNLANGNPGAAGVSTTFDGSVTILGGSGGGGGTSTAVGAGGIENFANDASGIVARGEIGKSANPGAHGAGGSFGKGGTGGTNGAGSAGTGYGAGGGGARLSQGGGGGTGASGGAGTDGILIVSW